jgi:poly(hydroxyalkanoate) depolymerase family esterase
VTPAGEGVFSSGTYSLGSLNRDYKLFMPTRAVARGLPLPLLVMLHGCTQDPDDFAAGTGMNELAQAEGFCVLYPAQSQQANPQRCWNWFKHKHTTRGHGEAALISSLTQAVVAAQGLDRLRVYIAGLSAGGAMAAIVAAAYPEVFAAVGVHSGLPPGAATSLPEALSAMKGAGGNARAGQLSVPMIVFHGDRDQTVHPNNAAQLIQAASGAGARAAASSHPGRVEEGVSAHGQRYTRAVYDAAAGPGAAEQWVLHGAEHAWSGGRTSGSFTDPNGPDASREMLRFFREHPRRPGV